MAHAPASTQSFAPQSTSGYHRYHIPTQTAPDIEKWPTRFTVRVGRLGLAKLLFGELIHYRGRLAPVFSRPCMYGVFSGPVGGFAPRPEHCVGCLRCMMEFPTFVRVEHNAKRRSLGDSYFSSNFVDAISYESSTGMIPVKGAGYRGPFGGQGWDGMWTDMSEIVRPTRDGIHGREFISTVVDIGESPAYLEFDERGRSHGAQPRGFSIPLPIVFDPPQSAGVSKLSRSFARAAAEIGSLVVLPFAEAVKLEEYADSVVPVLSPSDISRYQDLKFKPRKIEMAGWSQPLFDVLREEFPDAVIALRIPFDEETQILHYVERGVKVFHLLADLHGRGRYGRFVQDMIRSVHKRLVKAGIRDQVTLIGGGGMVAAEHVPKAIISGLDVVALDTPLLVALQAKFNGECVDRIAANFAMPARIPEGWAVQRLKNLSATWRDQLLEILGAMGLREVRRLRGEMGRAMFMQTLEVEAFAGIEGYQGGRRE